MEDNDTTFNRRFLAYFAVGLCVAAMAYVAAITFLPLPKENARFADTVLGFILGTVLATPIAFFYGSSKSGQAKDQTIKAMLAPAVIEAQPEPVVVKVDDSTPVAEAPVAEAKP